MSFRATATKSGRKRRCRVIATSSATAAICWPSFIAGRMTDRTRAADACCPNNGEFRSSRPTTSTITIRRVRPLQDVLTATRHGCTVAELGHRRFPNAERHLRLARRDGPDLRRVSRSRRADRRSRRPLHVLARRAALRVSGRALPAGADSARTPDAPDLGGSARWRYPQGIPEKVRQLVEHELRLIEELHYEAYFLTVWDLVQLRAGPGHPVPGTRIGGQFGRLLLPGRDVGRPGADRRLVRAVPQQGAQRSPRHRHRFRARAPRGSHPVRLRKIRPRSGRHDRLGHHLPAALGRPRRRQGARLLARGGRRPGQVARELQRERKTRRPFPRIGPRPHHAGRPPDAGTGPTRSSVFRGTCRSTSAAWC